MEMETETKNKLSIPMAIIVAGVLIAGAIYFSSTQPRIVEKNDTNLNIELAPINNKDRILGNKDAEITLILYEDFQCPFCGAITGLASNDSPAIKYLKQIDPNWTPFLPEIMNYVMDGNILLVFRDWAFLGPESIKAAEAARCAGDQGKFWEYHDYLYSHQDGENEGAFADKNLKSFAKTLELNSQSFDKCLDEGKYTQVVLDSKTEGVKAGVNGTPKGFILKDGVVVDTIDGAESFTVVKEKLDAILK